MSTIATLTYTVSPVVQTAAQIAALLSAVVLPTGDIAPFGATLTSDTTAVVGPNAVRTLVFSLVPVFQGFTPGFTPPGFQFQGAIVSSSPQDAPGGSGAQQVAIAASGISGAAFTLAANLNGTTPVPLILTTGSPLQRTNPQVKAILTPYGVQNLSGASVSGVTLPNGGTPAGMLSIFSDNIILNPATGLPYQNVLQQTCMFQSAPTPGTTWQGSIVSTSPLDAPGGIGARTVTISYTDGSGAPQTNVGVALNGNTPVLLPTSDHGIPTNIVVASSGVLTSNAGAISIMQGNNSGAMAGQLPPSFLAQFPTNLMRQQFFKGMYLFTLSAALQSGVAESVVIS